MTTPKTPSTKPGRPIGDRLPGSIGDRIEKLEVGQATAEMTAIPIGEASRNQVIAREFKALANNVRGPITRARRDRGMVFSTHRAQIMTEDSVILVMAIQRTD